MPVTPTITITGTLQSVLGTADAGALIVQLCGFNNHNPVIPGTAVLDMTAPLAIQAAVDGTFGFELYGNDVIEPGGTYYTIAVRDSRKSAVQVNAYIFEGTEDIDLSDAASFVPGVPPEGIYVVPFACGHPIFDAAKGTGQSLTLTGNAVAAAQNFLSGVAVPVFIKQDATGGREFTWPATFQDPPGINMVPDGITTSLWFLAVNGNYYRIGAALWF